MGARNAPGRSSGVAAAVDRDAALARLGELRGDRVAVLGRDDRPDRRSTSSRGSPTPSAAAWRSSSARTASAARSCTNSRRRRRALLPGVAHRAGERDLRRLRRVGVGRHVDAVLAAHLELQRHEAARPSARRSTRPVAVEPVNDTASGARVEQRAGGLGAARARPAATSLGSRPRAGARRAAAAMRVAWRRGLEHDRVAGLQRRRELPRRDRGREVPRRDEHRDAARDVDDADLARRSRPRTARRPGAVRERRDVAQDRRGAADLGPRLDDRLADVADDQAGELGVGGDPVGGGDERRARGPARRAPPTRAAPRGRGRRARRRRRPASGSTSNARSPVVGSRTTVTRTPSPARRRRRASPPARRRSAAAAAAASARRGGR